MGQDATDSFIYAIRLGNGTLSWATAVVHFKGVNDGPVIAAASVFTGAFNERSNVTGSAAQDQASGTITFQDVDLIDTHTVAQTAATFTWSGGTLTVAQKSALTAASSQILTSHDSTGTGSGYIDWTYKITDSALDFLAAGEKLTVKYDITLTDNNGASAVQTVKVIITGSNDAPTITTASGQDAGSVSEAGVHPGNTPFAGTPSAGGTLTSSDVDHNATATWSGSTSGTYGSFAINPTTGAWTYTLDNSTGSAADRLKQGEVVTEHFTATVTDDFGATATDTVTITIAGTNDAPVVTTAAGQKAGAVSEAGVHAGNTAFPGTLSASGTLTSSDVDHHATATWSGDAGDAYGSFVITGFLVGSGSDYRRIVGAGDGDGDGIGGSGAEIVGDCRNEGIGDDLALLEMVSGRVRGVVERVGPVAVVEPLQAAVAP